MRARLATLGRRRLLVVAGVLAVLAAVALAVADPFAGNAASGDSSLDNGSPTAIRPVERTSLSSQTPVSGTLGYAGAWTVSAPTVSAGGIYTELPVAGDVVRRGQRLYAIDGQGALLLYGSTPAWRTLRYGISGQDVRELNANLRSLGYGAPRGDAFTSGTAAAVSGLQRAHGLSQTGVLPLGAVVFEPGPLRVTSLTPTVGQPVGPGPLLTASSTRHSVAIQLDAAQQSDVKVGDRVTVTLPDNSTTPGVVTFVGKVATTVGALSGSVASGPTIEVDVRLLHASAAGTLDQAPVDVSITGASVHGVLAVPVDALLALAGGGYAVEEVEADGAHTLVAVTPGLFDDARGLVEVSGSGLAAGQRVVVPAQ